MQSYKSVCQLIFGFRAIVLKGLKAKKMYEQLLEMYPSKCTVEFWAGEFKRGRTRLEGTKNDQKPQPHQKSLSKFIILLVKIHV